MHTGTPNTPLGRNPRPLFLMIGCGLFSACFDSNHGVDPDLSPSEVSDVCGLTLDVADASGVELVVGGHHQISLEVAGDAAPHVVSAPANWDVAVADGGAAIDLVAPYEAPADAAGQLVLSDGCPGQAHETTIALGTRPARWSPMKTWTEGVDGPRAREYFAFWADAVDPDVAYVFGGFHYVPQQFTPSSDLWRLDLTTGTWAAVEHTNTAPMLAGGGMAHPPAAGASVYYGGLGRDGNSFTLPFSLQKLELGERATWTALTPDGAPMNGDYQPAFFWEPTGQHYLAVGGQGPRGAHINIHAYHPGSNTWLAVTPDTPDGGPDGRTGFYWVHDAANKRLIVFGGDRGGEAGEACDCAPDTWALELGESPMRWVLLADGDASPSPRRNGAYVLDHANQRMLIWGGTFDGATALTGIYALDLRRGHEAWHLLATDGAEPPPRASAAAIHDAARNRIVAGFGNSSEGVFVDLWALEL